MQEKKNGKTVNMQTDANASVDSKLQYAVFNNAELKKDDIKGWLKKDVYGVYLLLSEVLASNEVLDALTEVFWKRYQDFHAQKVNEPELPLK